MDLLTFKDVPLYTPNTLALPEAWQAVSFNTLDFTDKSKLKNVLITYLEKFEFNGRDSLLIHSDAFAFRLFVSLYREIGSHITPDNYKLLNWPSYIAALRSEGFKGLNTLMQDLYSLRFLFIFDLTLSTKDDNNYFEKIVDYTHLHNIILFIVTRIDGPKVVDSLPLELAKVFNEKFLRIGINE